MMEQHKRGSFGELSLRPWLLLIMPVVDFSYWRKWSWKNREYKGAYVVSCLYGWKSCEQWAFGGASSLGVKKNKEEEESKEWVIVIATDACYKVSSLNPVLEAVGSAETVIVQVNRLSRSKARAKLIIKTQSEFGKS